MVLIKCPGYGKDASTNVQICLKCGKPINTFVKCKKCGSKNTKVISSASHAYF